MKNSKTSILIALIFAVASLLSCENNKIYTASDATLQFSTDTVSFDTLFTTIGSSTQHITVHNTYDEDIIISNIELLGDSSSNFRINIDGSPETSASETLLRAKDSLYIFIDVNIDPSNQDRPLLTEDFITFTTNGNEQQIILQAYRQDAHHMILGQWGDMDYTVNGEDTTYHIAINRDTAFTSGKPYYLRNNLVVGEGVTITFDAGTRLFIGKDINISIEGSIQSNGTLDEPVVIRGDRFDELYIDLSFDKVLGQWGTISLEQTSFDNYFTHTHIRNGLIGLLVDSLSNNSNPKVVLNNCRVENMSSRALWLINTEAVANNCLFANCGQNILAITSGGKYDFTHCTFGNYYYLERRSGESVDINNYTVEEGNLVGMDLTQANFTNCIIYGTYQHELTLDNEYNDEESSALFNYNFENCLISVSTYLVDTSDSKFSNVIWNESPLFFDAKEEWDFHLDTLSPAIDKGVTTSLTEDINKMPYINAPDLGAFEFAGAKE